MKHAVVPFAWSVAWLVGSCCWFFVLAGVLCASVLMFAHVCCWMLLCMCPGGCVCFGLLLLHSLFGVPCLSCLALFLRAWWSHYTCLISIDVQLAWACVGGHSISLQFCQKKLPVIQGTGYNHFCIPAETQYGHDDCIRSSAYLISFLSQAGEERKRKGTEEVAEALIIKFQNYTT